MARLTPGTRVRVTGYNCSSRYSKKMLPVGSEHTVDEHGCVPCPNRKYQYSYQNSGYSTDATFCNHIFQVIEHVPQTVVATVSNVGSVITYNLTDGSRVRVVGYSSNVSPENVPTIGAVGTVHHGNRVTFDDGFGYWMLHSGYINFELVSDETTEQTSTPDITDEKVSIKEVLHWVHDRLSTSKTSQNRELLAPMRFAYVELLEQVFGITENDLEAFDRVAKILA